ncbi:MAG TPA: hypothetical protein VFH68_02055 [Polyangia bacterium]|nr:hypothetical protein [Polyangia bacterium]
MRTAGDRCPDHLLARSRRGPLSLVERRALQAHAAVCGLCRAALALGALHDAIPDSPQPGDDALVERLASQVASRHTGGHYRRGDRRRAWAVAAAVALLASAGGAAAWVTLRRPPPPARPTTNSAGGAPTAPARSPAPGPGTAPDPVAPAPAAAPPPVAAHRPARAAVAPSAAAASRRAGALVPEPNAADLFAAANAARGARDLRGAVTRYRLLQARYPGSAEARVSYVSAGDLLAQLAAPAEALAQFDRYLAPRPAGALAPEALFGRARSLQALDRRADENEAWRELLRRFPGSIYEVAARRRLDELAR